MTLSSATKSALEELDMPLLTDLNELDKSLDFETRMLAIETCTMYWQFKIALQKLNKRLRET